MRDEPGVFGGISDDTSIDSEIVVSDLSLGFAAHGGGAAFAAVEGVTFEVKRASVTALLGESGSGKSTLARFIAARGRDVSDRGARIKLLSGDARVGGVSVASANRKNVRELAATIGFVEQDAGAKLSPEFSVGDLLLEPVAQRFRRFDREMYAQHVAALLEAVDIPLSRLPDFPYQLSKGQRQRVALMRAFVLNPSILVLDEPTMGIDAGTRPRVIRFLTEYIRQHSATVVVVSHDIALLESIVDDVNILQNGAVVGRGHINEIFGDADHEYVQRLASALRTTAYDEAFED